MNKLALPLAPLLPRLELDARGAALLAEATQVPEALTILEEAGRVQDALRLMAHALPRREAVWWACMCARGVPARDATEPPAALLAAEAWVRRPDEAERRAAFAAAEQGGFSSPEDWAAIGAFWSGGSISPAGLPPVTPAENLTGIAISSAIIMAALRHAPEKTPARMQRFLSAARDIAGGGAGRLPPEEP